MFQLSDRQIAILKAVVEEYIETAIPVGSEPLERKYNLGVSPATIRNEMSLLGQHGYLKQPHTSAGRIPTALTLRLYVNQLMQESQLSVTEEVTTRERMWDHRQDISELMRESVRALATQLQTISLITLSEGKTYSSGYSYLLSMPEFYDIDVTRQVLSLVDENVGALQQLFAQTQSGQPVRLIFGEELNYPFLEPVGMVFADFYLGPNTKGTIGIIGPSRIDFSHVIPRVRYYAQLLEDLGRDW